MSSVDVIVVGAGLAGLRCARELTRSGLDVRVVEAFDGVGGRVRTDEVDGFLLDRGFQVFNDGYPEARASLDLKALDLRRLDGAIVVRSGGALHDVANPLQEPGESLSLLTSPLLSLAQKTRLGAYALVSTTMPVASVLRRPDVAADVAWRRYGFTDDTIRNVLTPFFSGVLLETEFPTTRRFTDLMMRMFARGHSTVPTRGMRALPDQLASGLPVDRLTLHAPVSAVGPRSVTHPGGTLDARAVVVATDAWTAAQLVPALGAPPRAKGVTTVYYSVPVWPGQRSRLIVDADGSPVVNTIVLSAAAPSYAPAGRALVSSSVLHSHHDPEVSDAEILPVLAALHEQDTSTWERLAAYSIPQALPAMDAPHSFRRSVRLDHDGGIVYVCGDHRDTASIQGALVSGRRTAEAVLVDLRG